MSRIGLIQMNSGRYLESNMQVLEQELAHLQSQGVKLVVTPENALLFATKEDYQNNAECLAQGPIQKRLSELAQKMSMWLVIGSFPIRCDKGFIYSTCLIFNADGQCCASYQKLHLFDVDIADNHHYRESDIFKSGKKAVLLDTPFGKVGLSICYDLRFPALYSLLRHAGADIILVPAAFTQLTGEAHWQILLRARAIETQCWLVGAAQCGKHYDGRETFGHSMIIDPWGNIICQLKNQVGTVWADINLAKNKDVRTTMPVLQHAKLKYSL